MVWDIHQETIVENVAWIKELVHRNRGIITRKLVTSRGRCAALGQPLFGTLLTPQTWHSATPPPPKLNLTMKGRRFDDSIRIQK